MTEQDLISHYDANLDYWSPVNKDSVDGILEKLNVTLSKESNVLDIGCGDGRLLRLLSDKYGLYGIGIDYSKKRIKKARTLTRGNIYYSCRPIQQTEGLSSVEWDYGFMFEVLEHLEKPELVLDKYRELCKVVVGSVPINMPYKAHLQVFTSVRDVEKRLNVNVIYRHGRQAYFRT